MLPAVARRLDGKIRRRLRSDLYSWADDCHVKDLAHAKISDTEVR